MDFNKRFKYISASLLITALIISLIINPAFSEDSEESTKAKLDEQMEYLRTIIESVEENYVHDVEVEELVEGAIKGIFEQLDQHSNYYNPKEFGELYESVSGDYSGIGAYIGKEDEYITIVSPIEGSPAQAVGLKAGDKVISVDGQSIKGYTTDQAIKLIKGKAGTNVKLGVLREGKSDTLYFDITRDVIKINPVSYEIKEDNIGYIRISQFNSHTVENMNEVLNVMNEKGIEKLVIDLRNNPGGYLDQVITILHSFVPDEGPIVHINYGKSEIETYNSTLKEQKYEVAVLVNEGSASASEIFAGAIQDSGVGTVIGKNTYGKGTVQTIYRSYNGEDTAGMKLTIAEYLTPSMTSIDGKGIKPDIVVENGLPETNLDLEDIADFRKKDKPGLNDVSLDVLTAEQILTILGYNINEPDGVMDGLSFKAVKEFQSNEGLYSYGVVDYTTQNALVNALEIYIAENIEDKQLNVAIETLKK